MVLSWNEIKDRALKFSKEWEDTVNEDAEAKPFLVVMSAERFPPPYTEQYLRTCPR